MTYRIVVFRSAFGAGVEKGFGFLAGCNWKLPGEVAQITGRMIEQPFKTGFTRSLRCRHSDRKTSDLHIALDDGGLSRCRSIGVVVHVKIRERFQHGVSIRLAGVQILESLV
jgi:hypothetical protein